MKCHRSVGLIGAIGNGDLGDVALLINTIDELETSQLFDNIVVFSSDVAETRRYLSRYHSVRIKVVPMLDSSSFLYAPFPVQKILRKAFKFTRDYLRSDTQELHPKGNHGPLLSWGMALIMRLIKLGWFFAKYTGVFWFTHYATSFQKRSAGKSTSDELQSNEFLANIMNVDVLLSIGGGYLNSNWSSFACLMAAAYLVANRYGKDVILAGQTIGPLNMLDRFVMKSAITKAKLIGVRDKGFSMRELSKMGVNLDLVVESCDEAAFLEKDEHNLSDFLCDSGLPRNQSYIILQLHDWGRLGIRGDKKSVDEVLREVAGFCDLVTKDYDLDILYMPMQTMPSRDAELGQKVSSYMKMSNRMHFIKPGSNPRILKAIVGKAQIVVHTRLHPLVFAIGEGTPTLTICCDNQYYKRKLLGLMALLDVDISLHTLLLDDVTSASLYKAFHRIITSSAWVTQESVQRNREAHNKFWSRLFKIASPEASKID